MNVRSMFVATAAFIVSTLLTGQFRRYALARGILDVPNARSSHETPTPRGGGVAIVVAVLLALLALTAMHIVSVTVAAGLAGAGAIAATIGYLDDRRQVSLLLRLAAHFAAAGCVVWFIGYTSAARALSLPAGTELVLAPLALLYLVWMLNLTNFMDGIDGIASTEIITVCTGVAACVNASANAVPSPGQTELIAILTILAAAAAGFLRWNWSPAKIFMGDAGSGFLGVLLGALSFVAANVQPQLFWSCLILGGVFVVDATVTLLRRIARREKFYHAHRSHAYQHAARRWNHSRVSIAVALINLCWLLPWAVFAARGTLQGAVALVLAYIPLLAVAIRFQAGIAE